MAPQFIPSEQNSIDRKMKLIRYLTFSLMLLCGGFAAIMVSCSREVASLAPSYLKSTPTPIPGTPTFTPTPTPFLYEDFDNDNGMNSNGNCWVAISPCPSAAGADKYLDDDYNSNSCAVTLSINSTAPYVHSGTNSEAAAMTFTAASNTALGTFGIASEYGSGCGGSLTVPASDTTASSTMSYWMYPITQDSAPMTFVVVMYVNSTYSYYQNGTGSNVQLAIPSGQWSQVTVPLLSSDWSPALPANGTAWGVTYIETWVLHSTGPAPYGVTAYVDDYLFNP